MPKLKGVAFETASIERCCRCETSSEEALIEMYFAGVSVQRAEDITEALWGTKVSPGTISDLNKRRLSTLKHGETMTCHHRIIRMFTSKDYSLSVAGAVSLKNVSIFIAIGVSDDGYREIIGVWKVSDYEKENNLRF